MLVLPSTVALAQAGRAKRAQRASRRAVSMDGGAPWLSGNKPLLAHCLLSTIQTHRPTLGY